LSSALLEAQSEYKLNKFGSLLSVGFFYSIVENLVLWASSEKRGSAKIKCHGVLE